MVRCPRCGVDNPAGFRFCGACGNALGMVVCPSCGSPVPDAQRFCGTCGESMSGPVATSPVPGPAAVDDAVEAAPAPDPVPVLLPQAPATTGERKLATIVFADVVGFTGLAEQSDHEAVAGTVSSALTRLAEIVDDHGGTVDKFLGDGLMAVFGVPVSHDDDAERAVAAALAMRDAAGELRFSIGVNTGEVTVTLMPGDERRTVIGDAVNVAARLEKAASAGEVLAGPLTAELAGKGVAFRERGSVVLPGRSEPIAVHEAMELRSVVAAEPGRPPLVGRDDELAFLCSRWTRCVRDDRAEAVLLIGEVGTGKSRILDELAAHTDQAGNVIRATYPAYGALSGARVVRQILEHLGSAGDPTIDLRLESLAGQPVPQDVTVDPLIHEQEQLKAFRVLIEHHARERPIMVLLDEVQRANDRTLRFLGELAVRVEAPVLLVLAGRPEPEDWLLRFPHTTRLRLEPLGRAEAAELAAALVPEGRLSPEAAAVLAERGAGNPLHLRELVRLVRERNGLTGDATALQLRGDLALPPSLHAVLAARLDALPAGDKAALQHIAVLGDEATVESLPTLGLGGADGELRRLVSGGLIREREGGRVEIVDPLLRDVAYESLPREARCALHRRAAAISEREEERARHLELALSYRPGDAAVRAEAARALGDAGLRLAALHRSQDAAAQLRRAVELGYAEPKGILHLAQSLVEVGSDEEALDILGRLRGDLDPAEAAEAVHVQANAQSRRHPEQSVALYRDAQERWRAIGNRHKEAWAIANAAVALTLAGRPFEASGLMQDALERFTEIADRVGMAASRQFLGILHPDDPRVEGWMYEGLAWARESGDPTAERYSQQSLVWHHYLRAFLGGPDHVGKALEHAQTLDDLAARVGDQVGSGYGLSVLAILRRGAGDLEGAADAAEAARTLRLEQGTGSALLRDAAVFTADLVADPLTPVPASLFSGGDSVGVLAIVAAAVSAILAGRIEDGARMLDSIDRSAFESAGLQVFKFGIVDALRHVLTGDPAQAASQLVGSVSAADLIRAIPASAAARALLAEALLRQGDEAAARTLLDEIGDAPGGIAALLVLRARALAGDATAEAELEVSAARMHAPGALLALPARRQAS